MDTWASEVVQGGRPLGEVQMNVAQSELGISRRLQSLRDVQKRVPFSRSTIYAKIKNGDFPAPIKISENRVAWDSEAIDNWIANKVEAA